MILSWVNDVVEGVAAFFTGLRTTGRYLVENLKGEGGASAMTRQYPQQPAEQVGNRQRGHLFNDAKICIVCHACDKVCPVDCFKMDGERDENNKMHCSRFDIDLSKCIYCGLCVRACPTDSLSMTSAFELTADKEGVRFLWNRNSSQLDVHFDEADMQRLHELSAKPRAQLSADERAWLDARVDDSGPHLIGIYGIGHYSPETKAKVDAEREVRKKAKDAAAAAAAAKAKEAAAAKAAAAAASPPPAAPSDASAPAAKTDAAKSEVAKTEAAKPAEAKPAEPKPVPPGHAGPPAAGGPA